MNCAAIDFGDVHSDGHAAADDNSCSIYPDDGDLLLAPGEARLGPLQFNGGPTFTMLPSPDSPLVDALEFACVDGADSVTHCKDQRSVTVNQWNGGDIGAVEVFKPLEGDLATENGTIYVRVLNAEAHDMNHGVYVNLATLDPAPPSGVAFPYGGFAFQVKVWGSGWPLDVEYFTPAPTNQVWKLFDGEWVQPPGASVQSVNGGSLWGFRVVDGGFGDNDFSDNAVIVDPFAVGIGAEFTG